MNWAADTKVSAVPVTRSGGPCSNSAVPCGPWSKTVAGEGRVGHVPDAPR